MIDLAHIIYKDAGYDGAAVCEIAHGKIVRLKEIIIRGNPHSASFTYNLPNFLTIVYSPELQVLEIDVEGEDVDVCTRSTMERFLRYATTVRSNVQCHL